MAIIPPHIGLVSLLLLHLSLGDLEETFQRCCQIGTAIAAQDLKCDQAMSGKPVQGISAEQQSICLSTEQLCCVRTLRDIQCKHGKMVAARGNSCNTAKHDESKYCCEACKLGMISGSMASECELREFSMGEMWDETYQLCCSSIAGSPLPLPSTPPQPDTVSDVKPEQKHQFNENICDLLRGELCAHICVPVGSSSYRCDCEPGFTLMADNKSCHQDTLLNRCESNNPCQHLCTDTGIAIECSCHTGFQLHSDNKTCVDLDECKLNLHDCTDDQTCVNELGTFLCRDTPRTTLPPTSTTKLPLQSLVTDPDSVTEPTSALDKGGDRCPFGYIFNQDTQLCRDVDECETGLHVCGADEACANMPGGYRCAPKQVSVPQPLKCQPGYKYSQEHTTCIDVDECEENNSLCDSNQMCENTVGSHLCRCKQGFQLDSITQACVDINECQVDLHNCIPSQRCDNTIGSFQCVRYTNCGTGYTLNAQTGLCEDNDECAQHMCDHLGPGYKCRNTLGFFRCDKIFEHTTTSKPCDTGTCTSASTDPGVGSTVSHTTLRCPRGYYLGPDKQCFDVNECLRGNACQPNQACVNIPGGYVCSNKPTCEPGLRLNEETNQCVDIDECTEQPGLCGHRCHNTWGSFRCYCRAGFTLFQNNRTCVDINECEVFKDRRLCIGYCVNQPGSYSCQCPQGYRLGIDGASCQDIDECSSQNVCTGRNEVCLNMRGTYRCVSTACPSDYIKDSQHKNRCKRITMSCREGDMECLQKPLTYNFHFITLVSNLTRANGPIDMFMMRGPLWSSTNVEFELQLEKVHSPPTVEPAALDNFHLQRTDHNVANIRLLKPIIGPQDIFLQLIMKFFYNGIYGGTTISNIAIYVSQYEF